VLRATANALPISNDTTMLFFLPLTLLCVVVVWCCAQDIVRERTAPRLGPAPPPADGPFVSVIVPARNEADGIGVLLDGLARQTYRAFEVIVVDDDSTDGTGAVARGFTGRLPGLQVLTGRPLPGGWAGKCWACWQAAARARGEWLLFLDADERPAPELLAALVGRARASGADLITLMPLLRLGSLAERLMLPAFGSILYSLYPLALVSDKGRRTKDERPAPEIRRQRDEATKREVASRSRGLLVSRSRHLKSPVVVRTRPAFANGQCIFVRRAAYAAVGGHRAVQESVLEDVELAQRLRAAGFRLHAAAAPDLLEVRMYTSWASVAEGLGKNAIAGYRSGGWRSAWVGTRQALIALVPVWLLIGAAGFWLWQPFSPMAWVLLLHGGGLWLITLASLGWVMRRRYRINPAWSLCYPLGLALYYALAARALWRVRSGRGVLWKGRTLAGE
jgi:glycosyltransferase involved in cell wall biosynthesis